MKSDKQVSYAELVENNNNIIAYLIDRHIADFGRFSFVDMTSYIKKHLKFAWPVSRAKELADIYFLRNVIVHNAG